MSIISTMDKVDTAKYRINSHRSIAMDFGSLTVLDVHFSDRGTYSCNASNDIAFVTVEADLTVYGELCTHFTITISLYIMYEEVSCNDLCSILCMKSMEAEKGDLSMSLTLLLSSTLL